MTQPLLRPPTTLQPRPKANPTFSSSSIGSHVTVKTPQQSRPPSETRQSASPRPWSTPLASDRIDVALIRKVLCPQQTNIANDTWPIDELLPPLSSSNEIDLQLYTIIAIVVQELVYSWYGQITSDEAFVEEVVRIIAHCTRAVEGRLRKIDLESLLLDEIPGLVESHVLGRSSFEDIPRLLLLTKSCNQHTGSATAQLGYLTCPTLHVPCIMSSILIQPCRPSPTRHTTHQSSSK